MTRAFQVVAPEHTPWTLIEANTPEAQDRLWQIMPQPFVAKLPKARMGEDVRSLAGGSLSRRQRRLSRVPQCARQYHDNRHCRNRYHGR
jgi:hypothetical protein